MSTTDCVKKILKTAARIMRDGGIARGLRHDKITGAHCLLGAIDEAVIQVRRLEPCHLIGMPDNVRAVTLVAAVIPDRKDTDPRDDYNNDYGSYYILYDYNNNPGTKCAWYSNMMAKDAEDVAIVLEKAAATL